MNMVSPHRSVTRRFALEKQALDNVGSEIAGSILSPVTTGLTGAGIAALVAALRGKNVRHAAGGGALLGATLGAPLLEGGGILAGVLSKRRTRKEQQEHDSKSHWASLLPGVAAYNRTKRKGRVLAGVGEPDEQKKAAEATDAAYVDGFCKAAETLGVSPRRLAVRMAVKEATLAKQAQLSVGNAVKFVKRLGNFSSRAMVPRLNGIEARMRALGRFSPKTKANFDHMRSLASDVDAYADKALHTTIYPGEHRALGDKNLFQRLVSDVTTDGGDPTGLAAKILKATGYLKG